MILQRSDGWFKERRGVPSASGFARIMGTPVARKAYAAELALERLTDTTTETYTSKEMQRGIELEPLARLRYMLATKQQVTEAEFTKHPLLNVGASPDGLIGSDGLLEIKIPLIHNHIETLKTGRVPSQYKWQLVGQQACTGRSWTDFVSFNEHLEGLAALAVIRVDRDEELIKELETELALFLDEIDELVRFLQSYGKEANKI